MHQSFRNSLSQNFALAKTALALVVVCLLLAQGYGQSPAASVPPITPLTRDEAVRLALQQASAFEQAQFSERSASEDVRQAKAAFYPRISAAPTLIYNSPSIGADIAHTPSFIGANAITEWQGLGGASGEIDTSGKLRAALRRSQALLAAAHAGTDVARRALIEGVDEAYYGLALATAKHTAADQNLKTANDFVKITELLVQAGEVAQVDLLRAQLQVTQRRDELEQAIAAEIAAQDSLRVLIGYDNSTAIGVVDLATTLPQTGEIDGFNTQMIQQRPEFTFFAAQRRALENEVNLARAERLPQFTYALSGGFASDSLRASPLKMHSGILATVGLTIPIFDWGVSKSHERQAQLRLQSFESSRKIATLSFNQQFNTARALAQSAAIRIRIAGSGVADAIRNFDISLARYRAGEAPIIEVTDAQNIVTAQRAALAQAIYDYQIALARLRQATGQ